MDAENEEYDKWQEPDDSHVWVSWVLWYAILLAAGVTLAVALYVLLRLVG